jgi:hypothetical protein
VSSMRRRHEVDPSSNPDGYYWFPELTGKKIHGVGRILMLLDRLLIPVLALYLIAIILMRRSQVVVSVSHGYYFLAAAVAAKVTATPFVLIVHDDWVALNEVVYIFRRFSVPLLGWALRSADHVYSIGEGMRRHLLDRYGVDSEIQMPSTQPNRYASAGGLQTAVPSTIIFGGMISNTVRDAIDLVGKAINSLRTEDGQRRFELVLYSPSAGEECQLNGWNELGIKDGGWLEHSRLQPTLASSDILLLPLGFDPAVTFYSTTSFPSKVADYLASGRPILLVGPEESNVVAYLRDLDCAELVTEPDLEAVRRALLRLSDPERIRTLSINSLRAFDLNHRIDRQRESFLLRLGSLMTPPRQSHSTH